MKSFIGGFIIATLIGTQLSTVAGDEECVFQIYDECTLDYAAILGFKQAPKPPQLVARVAQFLHEQGLVNGMRQLCKGFSTLQDCLGDQYNSCWSYSYLTSIGYDKKNALILLGTQKNLELSCKLPFFNRAPSSAN